MNSRQKGKRGELELAAFLRSLGIEARRGQQFSGVEGRDIVHSLKGVHFESKRAERARIEEWLVQAESERQPDEIAVVAYRRNRGEWIAILKLADFVATATSRKSP